MSCGFIWTTPNIKIIMLAWQSLPSQLVRLSLCMLYAFGTIDSSAVRKRAIVIWVSYMLYQAILTMVIVHVNDFPLARGVILFFFHLFFISLYDFALTVDFFLLLEIPSFFLLFIFLTNDIFISFLLSQLLLFQILLHTLKPIVLETKMEDY